MAVLTCVSTILSTALAKRTTMWAYSTIWTLLLFVSLFGCNDALNQMFNINEEIPIGTVIGNIGDGMSQVLLPFSNVIPSSPSDGAQYWDINKSTGEIKVDRRIDRDRNQGDNYIFIAVSQTGPTVTVTIHVNDINDNAPTFPENVKVTDLSESAPPGAKIPLGIATDKDLGENSTKGYVIESGNTDSVFSLGTKSENLELQVTGSLDYEITPFYSLLIQAYDGGNPRKVGYLRVNITVIDANDNQPIFNTSRYFAEIPENVTVGTSVLQVFATDIDSGQNGQIQYHINRQKSDQEQNFKINPLSGIISINKNLDYERKKVYELIVVASDHGTGEKLQTTAVVSVTVKNVNDNKPQIDITYLGNGTGKISEKAREGAYIARISVSDPDTDSTAHINVIISGGNDDGHFKLIVSNNVVYLVIASPIGRKMKPFYHLMLTATDTGSPPLSSSKAITLYISDTNGNSPVFEKAKYYADIQGSAPPGSSVIQMSAKDRDEGHDSVITYEIMHTPESHSDWFTINNHTGLITTRMRVDCETAPQATLTVVATDSGTPPLSASAEVVVRIKNVTKNQPQFEQSFYNVTVSESAKPGSCFLTVSASDVDCGQNEALNYIIPESLGKNYPQELEILTDSGKLCVMQSLDYEKKTSYEFTVEAVDQDSLSSTTVVKVNVIDVNDNKPVFYPTQYARTLSQDLLVGKEVVAVMATDADSGSYGHITYSISGGNGLQLFEINENTGLIILASQIPLSLTTTTLTISAHDGGKKKADINAQVDITILDNTQSPPVFEKRLYRFEVPENRGQNQLIDTVKAVVEGGSPTAIQYNIEYGDPLKLFSIGELDGDIKVAEPLDHDTIPYVLLNIRAQTGSQPLYGYAQVNITITDVNDNEPVFVINPLTIPIKENMNLDTPFYTVYATDIDSGSNGRLNYMLNGTSDTFKIDPQTGGLSLKKALDYEQKSSYQFVVKALDNGIPPKISTVKVLINVLDINDNSPLFTKETYNVFVNESSPVNTKFDRVIAADTDTGNNGRITYLLNTNSDVFGVFPNDGYIYNKVLLDRETQDTYSIEVLAKDGGIPPRSATATVSINIRDANDNSPVFFENQYTFYISENKATGTKVGFVSATDIDQSNTIEYSLTGPSDYFSVVGNRGEILTKMSLDREDMEFHSIFIQAKDSGTPPRISTVRVTVEVLDENDNRPEFDRTGEIVVSVDENKGKGTLVTTVTATDRDKGENATLKFLFAANNPSYIFDNFQIHPRTGRLTTLEILDHETRAVYSIEVEVEDFGVVPLKSSTNVKVSVNDENESEPTFDQAHVSLTVNENTPVDRTIGQVKAKDNDKSDTVSYYIVGGNKYGTFLVKSTSGDIVISRPVDYEESAHHTIQIRAVDSNPINPKSSIINVNITIIDENDNPPKFEQDPVILNIRENIPIGTIVHTYSAIDLDSGLFGRVKYEIISQSPTDSWFSIDENTGDLKTTKLIDYEQIKQISVIVKASDQPNKPEDILFSTVTTLISIKDKNDNVPIFKKIDRVDIMEDEPVGYPIMHVIATDADSQKNGRVSYFIDSGNNLGNFLLDSTTGLLSIAKPLDREIIDLFRLNVKATDHGKPPMINYTAINVYIVDVNDNAPKFDQPIYKAEISENALGNTSVVTVRATDKDIGKNAELNYLIPDGVLGNKFTIGLTTGLIRTSVSLDREEQETYLITAYVKDKAFPARYDSCTIEVTVVDENDNTPIFNKDSYQLDVPENTKMPSIHSVLAVDADTGRNGAIAYSIIGGNTGGLFAIDQTTGKLSCQALDRETESLYNLIVQARDDGVQPHSSITNVIIHVLDDNDNDPEFPENALYSRSIPEDTTVGTSVLKVKATDADEGDNAKITYSIDKNAGGIFKIDNITGVINTTGLLDREMNASYSFEVFATDGGLYGPRSERVRVVITVTDINDNSPVFTKIPYKGEIAQNTAIDTSVVTVLATDADAGLNKQVVYNLKETSTYFRIGSNDGVVRTKRVLDAAAVTIHHLDVVAVDRGNPSKSATGVVEIKVGNAISPDAPIFSNLSYWVSLREDSQFGDNVIKVAATAKGPLLFDFASGNEDSIFSIQSATGQITVKESSLLDYETKPNLRLIVIAARTDVHVNAYATVWVNLIDTNDNAPRFSQDRYVSAVWEGNNRFTYVTQVQATDLDSGMNSRITYSIISGNLHQGVKSFIIDPPMTGIVKTNIILDREIVDTWRLEVEAIDGGIPPRSSTCVLKIQVIDVNDHEPFFPAYPPVSVKEGVEPGTVVLQVTANDPDLNPILQYNFAPNGNPGFSFSIDAYSGRIAVAKDLDYEAKRTYSLTVQASDKNHTVNTKVTVNVIDENDNPPVFTQQSYQVSINEATGPGVLVTTVTATDRDDGNNAKILYSMISTPGFYINSLTGSIYTNQTVSYNPENPTIHLVVTAHDDGNPRLSAMEAVRVQVVDINNNPPLFSEPVYNGEISEDEQPGLIVVHASATDADDTYDNRKIDYSIVAGNVEDKFQIVTSTGSIVLTGALDRELISSYSLTIKAKDRGDPPLESRATVKITVVDVNDNSPVFSQHDYNTTVAENITKGTHLIRVTATDKDTGPNGKIQYQIASGNDDNNFVINRDTGSISLRTGLDYETHQVHRLIIGATDSSVDYSRQSAFTTVIINVTDVNEYEPRFPVLMYIESVGEKQSIGTSVFTAHANDQDAGVFGVLKYELIKAKNKFVIDEVTGIVTTHMQLLYTNSEEDNCRFEVKATDKGGYSSTVPVLVEVLPRFIPRFTKSQFDLQVRGDAKRGDEVGTVQVENGDKSSTLTNSAGVVSFSLKKPNDHFEIVSSTGMVKVSKDLQSSNATRKKRSSNSLRHRRALVDDEVVLNIIASVGYPPIQDTTIVRIAVDHTCFGCQPVISQSTGGGSGLTGTPLVLLIVFLLIAAVLAVVIIIMFLRGREKRKRKRDSPRFDTSFNSMDSHPHPPMGYGPPAYNDAQMYPGHLPGQMTGSSMSEHSASVSSGRGSADMDIPEDEEIRMINATPMDNQGMRIPPDSGIQHDEDALSEHSAQNHQEYLARLGIDTSKLKTADNKHGEMNASVESMHQFSDEGGGEGDGMDIGAYQHQQGAPEEAVPVLETTQQFGFQEPEQSNSGSLSSVINSEEEFSGSYNWDYLLDWGPQYQPLADVFTEIARLKDDSIKPKKVPTKIISQNSNNFNSNQQLMRPLAFPPPIITDAPPRALSSQQPLVHSSQSKSSQHQGYNRERKDSSSSNSIHTPNSARTSQLTSMASLPKSPISYESSFTTTPLSPDFENSLSPLQHRSPSFSPIVTPKGVGSSSSGHNTPHNGVVIVQQGLQRLGHASGNMHPASSGSEQEFRI